MVYWYKRNDGYVFSAELAEATMIHGNYEYLGASDGKEYMRIIRESGAKCFELNRQMEKATAMLVALEEKELTTLDEKLIKAIGKKKDVLRQKLAILQKSKNDIYADAKKIGEETELALAATNKIIPDQKLHEFIMPDGRELTPKEQKNWHDR